MRKIKKCMLCGIELGNLAVHLKYIHNMVYKDYYDLYIREENEGFCLICGIETPWSSSGNYNKYCRDHFNRKEQLKLVRTTENFKNSVSKSAKERVKDPNSNFGKPRKWDNKRRKEQKELATKMSNDPNSKFGKRHPYTEEGRNTISKKATEMLKDPNDKFGKPSTAWSIEYNGTLFKSSWESNFAMKLDLYGISWFYESFTFKLQNGSRYTPDFYLPSYDLYIEIKPLYRLHEFKEELVKQLVPKIHYLVVTEETKDFIVEELDLYYKGLTHGFSSNTLYEY